MLERWLKPRTEHPDPKIREQAFAEIDPDDAAFKEAVRFDADASVRASLLARLTDLPLLVLRCTTEDDEHAAGVASDRLSQVLCGAAESVSVEQCLGCVESLDDTGVLTGVVTGAESARVRDAALSRIVACGAELKDLLIEVASGDADADLRSRAVDLIADPEALDVVAVNVRKSDKDLHRRARDKIRAIRQNEENEHARQQLAADIVVLAARRLEVQHDALHRRLARLQHWRDGWTALGLDDSDEAVTESLAVIEARINEVRESVAQRKTILDEIAGPADKEPEPAADQVWRSRWSAIEDHRESDNSAFEHALAARTSRQKQFERVETARTSAATLLGEWDATDWSATFVDDERRQKLNAHWLRIGLPDDADPDLHKRYVALRDRLRDLQARQQADAKTAGEDATGLVESLAAHLKAGRSTDATSAHDKLNHRLAHGVALPPAVSGRIRRRLAELEPELRKLKEWRHWGADQAREQLCGEAEALVAQAGDIKANKLANRVKGLRDRWQKIDKGVGAASESLWKRFDTACEAAYAPAKESFDKQAGERRENAARKRAICERLESYTKDTDWSAPDWKAATELLDTCRREWREVGAVSHRQFARLRDRHRRAVAALDEKLNDEREREVRRRKLATAALKQGLEREPLSAMIESAKKVQREWRPTVRARRREEQALWDDLREVCDAIFAQRDQRTASRRDEETAGRSAREALCKEIESLLAGDGHDEAAINQATGRFEQIRREWRDAGPLAAKQRATLDRRYRRAGSEFEARRDRLRQREHGRHTLALLSRALLADELRQRLGEDPAADTSQLHSDYDALPATRGALAKRVDAAFHQSPDEVADKAANLEAKRSLCLRLELLADTPTPAEFQPQRMALKIALLKDALAGGSGGDREATLYEMLAEWPASAPVDGAEWPALRQRFESAARALIGEV